MLGCQCLKNCSQLNINTLQPMNNHTYTEPLLIACSDKAYIANSLPTLLQYFDVNIVETDAALRKELELNNRQIVVLDSTLFDFRESKVLTVLHNQYPESKFVVMTESRDQSFLLRLVKAGARGYFHPDLEGDLLVKAMDTVAQDGMWVERNVMEKLLLELGRECRQAVKEAEYLSKPKLTALTTRENEIAHLIAMGNNDKKLASELKISTNTVKNHLQNIYLKLGVSDRLQLALLVNGIKI